MAMVKSILSKFSYWPLREKKKRRVKKEKGVKSHDPVDTSNVCSDVSVDIVLVTQEIEWKILTPIFYMNSLPDAFQEAFRDPKKDPWGIAQVSTWGLCQNPATMVFKAVLKQTGEAIGFVSFHYPDLVPAEYKIDRETRWLEKKGMEGELLRLWWKEIEDLREKHVGGNNYVCKSKFCILCLLSNNIKANIICC
jgi:hypothetical protein